VLIRRLLLLRRAHHAGLDKCEYKPDNKTLYSKHLVREAVVGRDERGEERGGEGA
jgi:hypothetical protein